MVEVSGEEQSWIAHSRKGDQQAFEALVLRYQKMIFALAYRMTRSQSWFHRIATDRCLNWRRRDARRARAYENWGREQEIASTTKPHADAISAQVQCRVATAVFAADQDGGKYQSFLCRRFSELNYENISDLVPHCPCRAARRAGQR